MSHELHDACSDDVAMRLLRPDETAERLGVKTSTLANWRIGRGSCAGPRYTKVGSCVFYREDEVVAFIKRRTISHTAQALDA